MNTNSGIKYSTQINDMTSPPAPLHDGEGCGPKRERVSTADVIPTLHPSFWVDTINDFADVIELIRNRYSCRVCEKRALQEELRERLETFASSLTVGPLGTSLRFMLSASSETDTKELKGLGTYGFIRNPAGFFIGTAGEGQYNLEDFGYAMEMLVLYATALGVGTCWLGGSFSRSSFSKKVNLNEGEILPAVVSLGYPAPNSEEHVSRRLINSDRRLPWEKLFFDGVPGQPMGKETAGEYTLPLKMVRLAPSASNRQPWRIIREKNIFHFYLQRNKGLKPGSFMNRLLKMADLQRVDMGIALCHFELTNKALGLSGNWETSGSPGGASDPSWEYIISWKPA